MSRNSEQLLARFDPTAVGRSMYELATEMFPFCRSITGDGVRQTLRCLVRDVPLTIHEVPTGTPVFDWVVPKEWNIRDAWIKDERGRKVVDFAQSNLHVLNYSQPVHGRMPLSELDAHLYTLPNQPEAIPYKTSYYKETWGFCMSQAQRDALPDGEYEYRIDSTLGEGSLTYGEAYLPGRRQEEILFSAHVCHPSLANDNLSAIVVLHQLAMALAAIDRKFSYRFVFAPGTIGAITWLARNEARLGLIHGGVVTAGLGDSGEFTYKRSRSGVSEIDLLVERALRESGASFHTVDFSPDGYDERQYNSPGIGLPVGRLSRTPYGTYPEYHTSGDNLDFILPDSLSGALDLLLRLCCLFETSPRFENLSPKAEPQLGRRGLYSALGGHRDSNERERAMQWVLNYSDGEHCLADIAERSGLSLSVINEVAEVLEDNDLLGRLERD